MQRTSLIRLAIATAVVLLPCLSMATNLGVIGPVYPIQEQHLLDFIRQRIADMERSGELKKLEEQARARGVESINHPQPVAGIRATETARTFYFDPTFTLERNVQDGTGRLLFPAGTRKNPLEVISLSKHLLFFDARDKRQVKRASELIAFYQGQKTSVKPILVGGSYLDLMRAWHARVYYDQQGVLTRRLGIMQVPAVVSQEGMRLRIDELALPGQTP